MQRSFCYVTKVTALFVLLHHTYTKSHTQPPTSKWIIQAPKGHYCSFTVTLVMQFYGQLASCHQQEAGHPSSALLTPPAQFHPLFFALVLVLKACQEESLVRNPSVFLLPAFLFTLLQAKTTDRVHHNAGGKEGTK